MSGCQRGLLGRKEILQDGASFVHLLWHFNLKKKNQKGSVNAQIDGCCGPDLYLKYRYNYTAN